MHVFISHRNTTIDKQITQDLVDYLAEKKIFCWADFKDIKSGYWSEQISKALNTADFYIIVASADFFKSDECINELDIIAKSLRRSKVLPFHIDDYYKNSQEEQNKRSYQLGSLESVFLNNYEKQEDAFEAIYVSLPKELTIKDCSPKDFVFKDDMRTLEKYVGKDEIVTLPDMISGISERAFLNNENLQKIVIPKSVKTIGKHAFTGCKNLRFVDGMDGIISCAHNIIDRMGGDSDLDAPVIEVTNGVKYFGKVAIGAENGDLREAVIKEGTRVIANGAFKEMFSLEKVVLPLSLVSIGDVAFKDCIKLKNINIFDGIEIGKKAFYGCDIVKD